MAERLDKSDYMQALMVGRIADPRLLDACLTYWHSGVPLSKAREYLNTLENKFASKARKRHVIERKES